jgi:hypothetical protein
MDSALAWIGQIASWIGQWFPRWTTLDMTQGAVKTTGSFFKEGVVVKACGPGLHWWWPAVSNWETYPTSFQTDNLPSQTVETKDGAGVTVSGMISYRVKDVGALLTNCHSPVMAIRTVTLPAIHQVASRMDWAEAQGHHQHQAPERGAPKAGGVRPGRRERRAHRHDAREGPAAHPEHAERHGLEEARC